MIAIVGACPPCANLDAIDDIRANVCFQVVDQLEVGQPQAPGVEEQQQQPAGVAEKITEERCYYCGFDYVALKGCRLPVSEVHLHQRAASKGTENCPLPKMTSYLPRS